MKKLFLSTLLLALPLLANAYDIAVENADGVTIYYNYYNNGTELEVTRKSSSSYERYSGAVNIPEEVTYMSRTRKVTSIGDYAFQHCTHLTSITIPSSVTSIGESAFYDCYGLEKVIVKDIASWCAIPFSVSGYDYCYNNPLYFAHHLFSDENTEITDLVIPNSVTSIGTGAFFGCGGITSVTIPNSVTSIDYAAFHGCGGLTSVTIPNSVTYIGGYAFNWCSGLTSVTIPNSVTSIGRMAFGSCSGLTSVHITDLAAWCKIAFEGYESNPLYCAHHLFLNGEEIKDLVIPNSVTSIKNYAFESCSGLTSVTISSSVTNIGKRAFANCSGLTSVISKMENPCSIDEYCFHNDVFHNATLYVPKGATDKYKATNYWSKFVFIEEGEPGGSIIPDPKKCATPSISYANKKLTFSCETEGVEFVSEIKDVNIKKFYDNSINLSATYEISVYATKSGYTNSDVATATLVWTDAVFTETTPSASSAKAIAESIPMLISAQNGTITVRGEQNGHPLTVYTADGKMLGSATMKDGQASFSTNLQRGEIAIVKVGSKSVKIKM